ncbi:MAG: aminotransferase class I/II-fold pyridoxal phosphate-dependent enzyme [Clostridia bacterium]|nr:aminotransferase class I/II-fold pyridoxal phosphate-dependent enzyme [Clostridia bacterium]
MYRIGKEEIDALTRTINERSLFKINNSLQNTKHVDEALVDLFGVKHAIFMTSGHAALTSALIAMGIGPGDEVIVPAYTYISTAMAVIAAGAMPVIADADESLTLCPKDFEAKITPHTKAVIPVHIQGFPCKMDEIMQIAKAHDIRVLEDACQADGGSYKGVRLGAIGDAGALSFNYYKIVTCGEGGALLTNNREIFERSLFYHDSSAIAYFGNQMEDFTTEQFCGSEYRANELCAAVLGVQLTRMDGILADNRRHKAALMEMLAGKAEFAPINDVEGDCATTLALRFASEEEARRFAKAPGVGGTLPIDTGKHVYRNWTPIMEKRGALHPLMDPFKFEANRDIVPDYKADMCPKTLDILSRTVYVSINPDWTEAQVREKGSALIAAL